MESIDLICCLLSNHDRLLWLWTALSLMLLGHLLSVVTFCSEPKLKEIVTDVFLTSYEDSVESIFDFHVDHLICLSFTWLKFYKFHTLLHIAYVLMTCFWLMHSQSMLRSKSSVDQLTGSTELFWLKFVIIGCDDD